MKDLQNQIPSHYQSGYRGRDAIIVQCSSPKGVDRGEADAAFCQALCRRLHTRTWTSKVCKLIHNYGHWLRCDPVLGLCVASDQFSSRCTFGIMQQQKIEQREYIYVLLVLYMYFYRECIIIIYFVLKILCLMEV